MEKISLVYKVILQCDATYRGHLTRFFLQIIRQSGCANFINRHPSLQSSYGCDLNTVAWVVELTCLRVGCQMGGHGKAHCTVSVQNKLPFSVNKKSFQLIHSVQFRRLAIPDPTLSPDGISCESTELHI